AISTKRASGGALAAPPLVRRGQLRPPGARPAHVRQGRRGRPTVPPGGGMTRRRWGLLGVVAALIAVVVLLRGTAGNDSPEHSSASDAGNGTSALRYYAQALGHNTGTVEGEFDLPSSPALLFIFSPTTGFNSAEAQRLNGWLSSGNVVVYAAEANRVDPQLDQQFGLHRSRGSVDACPRRSPTVRWCR